MIWSLASENIFKVIKNIYWVSSTWFSKEHHQQLVVMEGSVRIDEWMDRWMGGLKDG